MPTGIEDMNLRGEKGWVCPTCGRSLSPATITCPFCIAIAPDQPTMPSFIPYVLDNRPECCRGCSNWPGPCMCAKPLIQWSGSGDHGMPITTVSSNTMASWEV